MPTRAHRTEEPLTFEKVWQMFQESRKQQNEMWLQSQESFAELRQMFKDTDEKFLKTDREFQETRRLLEENESKYREETARLDRKYQKRIRELDTLFTGQWGKLIESLTEGRLIPLLNKFGINVSQTYENATDDAHLMEFDIIADNGSESVVVEVKTTLKTDDVDYFIGKLDRFKKIFKTFSSKKVYGAVAFVKAQPNVRVYAEKKGLLVIKATSSGVILNAPEFVPRTW